MSVSQSAGTSFLPLLARLVLAAAFIPAGFHKIMDKTIFEGEEARQLSELGIGTPFSPEATAEFQLETTPQTSQHQPQFALTRYSPQEDTAAGTVQGAADAIQDAVAAVPVGPIEARDLYGISLLLLDNGWRPEWKPGYMAWAVALTELVGGVLLLVGFMGRLWGLGLAIAMGFAFFLTSCELLSGGNGFRKFFDLVTVHTNFHQVFAQLSLFVLAFGIFLTGSGTLSLDRFFFGGRDSGHDHDDDE